MGEVDEPLPNFTRADLLHAKVVCAALPCPPGFLVMPIAPFLLAAAFRYGFQPFSIPGHRFYQGQAALACLIEEASDIGRAYSGAWLSSKSVH